MPAAIAFPLLVAMSCSLVLSNKKSNQIISGLMALLFIVTADLASPTQIKIRQCVDKLKSLKAPNRQYFKDFNDRDIKKNIVQNLKAENIYPIKNGNQIPTKSFIKGEKILYLDDAAEFNYPNNKVKQILDQHCSLQRSYRFKNHFVIYEYEVK